MKQWLDFLPLLLFFIAFKTLGIFPATQILVASSVLIYGGLWLATRHLERNQIITLVATVLFGSVTLLLHDVTYLKWKAPIINWVFSLIFIGSHFVGKKLAIEHMLGGAITVPPAVWKKLNIAWVLFFIFAGSINWYVAFHWDAYWVDFKVFGSLGMTLTFIIAQTIYLAPHLQKTDTTPTDKTA